MIDSILARTRLFYIWSPLGKSGIWWFGSCGRHTNPRYCNDWGYSLLEVSHWNPKNKKIKKKPPSATNTVSNKKRLPTTVAFMKIPWQHQIISFGKHEKPGLSVLGLLCCQTGYMKWTEAKLTWRARVEFELHRIRLTPPANTFIPGADGENSPIFAKFLAGFGHCYRTGVVFEEPKLWR